MSLIIIKIIICNFQSFIWPLARPATAEENITVELRQQTTKILFKTGTSSSSSSGSSRGTIASSSKVIGQYVMLMQGKFTYDNDIHGSIAASISLLWRVLLVFFIIKSSNVYKQISSLWSNSRQSALNTKQSRFEAIITWTFSISLLIYHFSHLLVLLDVNRRKK